MVTTRGDTHTDGLARRHNSHSQYWGWLVLSPIDAFILSVIVSLRDYYAKPTTHIDSHNRHHNDGVSMKAAPQQG